MQTSDSSLAGIYELEIIGSISPYVNVTKNFTVNITDNCGSSTFTTVPVANQTYMIGDPTPLNFSIGAWTTNIAGCGTISYTAEYSNGTGLISTLMAFDNSTMTFSVSDLSNLA